MHAHTSAAAAPASLQRNLHDMLVTLEADLAVETGELMARARLMGRRLRCAAFNVSNRQKHDVFGMTAGGAQWLAAATHTSVFLHDLETGVCVGALAGKQWQRKGVGALVGHSQAITCLFARSDVVYTGGADALVLVWATAPPRSAFEKELQRLAGTAADPATAEAQARQRVARMVGDGKDFAEGGGLGGDDDDDANPDQAGRVLLRLQGHRGSVWSLAATDKIIVSGAADQQVRVWDHGNGQCLRVITEQGHTVRALEVLPRMVLSASVDGVIRLYDTGAPTAGRAAVLAQPPARRRPTDIEPRGEPMDVGHPDAGSALSQPDRRAIRAMRLTSSLCGHHGQLLCFQATGSTVVSGDDRGEVILWDASASGSNCLMRRCQVHVRQCQPCPRIRSLMFGDRAKCASAERLGVVPAV